MSHNETSDRLDNTTVCLPVVHGSVAFYLGKKVADEFQTHQWTLYLRGPNNEDLSCCISKVIFQLHPSFAQPVRELTSPPFEVSEKGWGEFEAQIRIVWNDTNEQSVTLNHFIKLYPPPKSGQDAVVPTLTEPDVPVVSESYDEIVFTDPTESFFRKLQSVSNAPTIHYSEEKHFPSYSDGESMQALLAAQEFLRHELQSAKQRFELAQADLQAVEEELLNTEIDSSQQVSFSMPPPSTNVAGGVGSAKTTSRPVSTGSGKTKKNPSSAPGQGNSKKAKASQGQTAAPKSSGNSYVPVARVQSSSR
jgi:YEATS domain-containing protein 4